MSRVPKRRRTENISSESDLAFSDTTTATTTIAPTRLTRYYHPSHPHKLFQNIVRSMTIFCDNQNCKRRLFNNEVDYVCFRCNFDLCARCFTLVTDADSIVPLHESDGEINEDVFFMPDRSPVRAKSVRTGKNTADVVPEATTTIHTHDGDDDDDDDDEEYEENTMDADEKNDSDGKDNNNNNNTTTGNTEQPTANAVITFENDNYDQMTSDAVNQLVSTSNGRIIIHHHHLHRQSDPELRAETVATALPEPTPPHPQPSQPSTRRNSRRRN